MENLKTWAQNAEIWAVTYLLKLDLALQALLIAVVFILSFTFFRLVEKRLGTMIDRQKISYRLNQILHNLKLLILPLTAICLLFPLKIAAAGGLLPLDFSLGDIAINLMAAWILIRLLAQFIRNPLLQNIVSVWIWVMAALNILGILDEATAALDAVGTDIGDLHVSILTLVKGAMALFIVIYGANRLEDFLEREIAKVDGLTAASRLLISKILKVTLVTLAILIGLTTAGIDLSLLAVFSGAVGLGVGFGLQKGISNLFSGILLLLDKSIKPGDVIELENGAFGWVAHMGGRYTEIITRDNKSFLIPNEEFITRQVVNWSHGDSLIRLEVSFSVSYDSDPHEVRRIAIEAAGKPERVVAEPAPVCHLQEFGDSGIQFVLRFWIPDAEKGVTNARGEVLLSIWDAFKENNITIPYPHRQIIMPPPDKIPAKPSRKTGKKTA